MSSLASLARPTPADLGPLYQDYAYGYPHKSAYRSFDAPPRLGDLWAGERKDRIFLYLHIPFCEMRCGFCNLFTAANPDDARTEQYLAALDRQIEAARDELGAVSPAQMAIGGGTPTLLGARALGRLLDRVGTRLNGDPARVSAGIETSPKTATPETIALLAERGFDRISIGVQSFIEAETRAMGRPQDPAGVAKALDTIRAHRFGRLNIDLIYGAANQTPETLTHSIRRALAWAPEEMFLYPLYVRARTGLDRRVSVEDEHRRALYRTARDLLLAEGYEQVSMRAFRRPVAGDSVAADSEFSCQEDGVLGLGTGARSYTRGAHYSSRYAVTRRGVLDILDAFAASDDQAFRHAHHGIAITPDEAMRRFVLKSLLHRDGLDAARFAALFGQTPQQAFAAFATLDAMGLIDTQAGTIRLTESGLEHSDAIPPLFYSDAVRALMRASSID